MEHEQIALWTQLSSDPELIAGVRAGDVAAFGLLYERHSEAARRVAAHYTNTPADVDDVVSEAFSRVLRALQQGDGPDLAFRAYLFTIVRRTGLDLIERGNRTQLRPEMGEYESALGYGESSDEHTITGFEQGLVADAFRALPERWQAVLWYTEVEKKTPAQIAPLLGLSANGVAALAYRAREALRQSYLQQHLAISPDEECRTINLQFGSFVRGGLSRREQTRVETHLAHCSKCAALVAELEDVNRGMRGVIAPLVLGVAAMGVLEAGLPVGGAFAHAGTASAAGAAGTGTAAGGAVAAPTGIAGASIAAALTAAGVVFTTGAAPASEAAGSAASAAASGGAGASSAAGGAATAGAAGAGTAIAGGAAGGIAATGVAAAATGLSAFFIPATAVTATLAMVFVGVVATGGLDGLSDDSRALPTQSVEPSALAPAPTGPAIDGGEGGQPSASPTPDASAQPEPSPSGEEGGARQPSNGNAQSPAKNQDTRTPEPSTSPEPSPSPEPTPTPDPDPDPDPEGVVTLALKRVPLDFLSISAATPRVAMELTNGGDAGANDVTASIALPDGLTFAPPSGGGGGLAQVTSARIDRFVATMLHQGFSAGDWTCEISADRTSATCDLPSLAPGAHSTFELDLSIDAALAPDATTAFTATSAEDSTAYTVRTGIDANDEGVTPVYADSGSLAAVHVGATMLGCDVTQPACAAVMASTVSGTGGELNNNGWVMQALNESAGAQNSAATTLNLPSGAVVTHASLEWTANRHPSDPLVGNAASARLLVPGAAGYADITADTVAVSTDPAGRIYYQSRLDVTSLVKAAGPGEYALADIALPGSMADPDRTYTAGFGLTVVYSAPGLGQSRVAIFDGAQWISADHKADFNFATAGPAEVTLGWTAFEADRGLAGDRIDIDGDTYAPMRWDGTVASVGDSGNAADGTANGGIHGNTLGIDAKMFRPGIVPAGNHVITVQSSGDNFLLSTLTVTVQED